MKEKLLIGCSAVLIFVLLLFLNKVNDLDEKTERIDNISASIGKKVDEEILQFQITAKELKDQITDESISSIEEQSERITENKIKVFQDELRAIQNRIAIERTKLEKIEDKRVRELSRLPEQVSLDDLYTSYNEKTTIKPYAALGSNKIESFNTEKGTLSFTSSNYTFAIVPSTDLVAWMKLGKNNSSLNSELIKAWLEESEDMKLKQGYRLVSNRTYDSDYGETTEKLFRNEDMYFKTYFQYQRVQGTYGRHSLQYTFHVEVGSTSRKDRYQLEQYNQKLGS
jgi:3-methyladenine DNA glycosylase AlkC